MVNGKSNWNSFYPKKNTSKILLGKSKKKKINNYLAKKLLGIVD